ncbi:hypothetical protein Q7P37_000967 [Cladosporium fusiforme]
MSLSTTCSLFWVDVNDNVVEVDNDNAVCDSTSTSCTITGSHGGTLQATCNSEQQYPDTTSSFYSTYFCACNGNSVSIPSGVTCSPSCYDLTTSFPTCNLVWVYNAFTTGDPGTGINQDTCEAFTCDSNGIECTDSSSTLLYQCDNEEHQSQVASDSTHSYICNCQGAAQIPDLYRGASGESVGSGCGNDNAGGGGETSATAQQVGTGAVTVTTASVESSPLSTDAPSSPGTTTAEPLVTSTTSVFPSSTISDSQGSASNKPTFSGFMVVLLCSSVLAGLLLV